MRHEVITLCGSVRFADAHLQEHRRLSLEGHVVLLPALPAAGSADEPLPTREALAQLHRRKIDMSSAVHVVDVDGYIGPTTRDEIAYARSAGKTVTYLSGRGPFS